MSSRMESAAAWGRPIKTGKYSLASSGSFIVKYKPVSNLYQKYPIPLVLPATYLAIPHVHIGMLLRNRSIPKLRRSLNSRQPNLRCLRCVFLWRRRWEHTVCKNPVMRSELQNRFPTLLSARREGSKYWLVMGRTFGELEIRRRIWKFGNLGESDDFFQDLGDSYKCWYTIQTDDPLRKINARIIFLSYTSIYAYAWIH